jgi:hypothetical protein
MATNNILINSYIVKTHSSRYIHLMGMNEVNIDAIFGTADLIGLPE